MIKKISFDEILPIWRDYLWPDRQSAIEPTSAMCLSGKHDVDNMKFEPTFFAYIIDGEIAGVSSSHMCVDKQYRIRGLFVFEKFRKRGIATALIKASVDQAKEEGAVVCWSYPRHTSWKLFESVGFYIASDWEMSETSNANVYCRIDL